MATINKERDKIKAYPVGGTAVTPHNTNDLARDGLLWVGAGGDVNVITVDGSSIVFVGIVGGTLLPVRIRRVLVTSTTASNMTVLW
ncbi:MAG TPA: hypothetical protein ENI20_18430 [Bacteroides sp.]|nr:hypothetical protein [Bacteroides sp.]